MRIVCISDTHQFHRNIDEIPNGDVLIHAGDSTNHGSLQAAADLDNWLGSLPHKHKLLIAGNHDFHFRNHEKEARKIVQNAIYLQDEGVTIEGVKFWGSPWSTEFGNWAFMGDENELSREWAKIPSDTVVLITHGPPYGILDKVARIWDPREDAHVGSRSLTHIVNRLDKLRLHVFGHIHEAAGSWYDPERGINFVNASTCDLSYRAVNPPIVFDLDETEET